MITEESFQTRSLAALPYGDAVRRILAAAVRAVEPGEAVRQWVSRRDETLTVSGERFDLASFRKIAFLGVGKASVAMSAALAGILGCRLREGLVVTKHAQSIADLPFRGHRRRTSGSGRTERRRRE